MSKLRHIPYAVLAAGLLFAGSASAQTWYNSREAIQRERIQDGRRDGSITGREYDRLMQAQHRIERYERYAERDGHVSRRESATLDRMLDHQRRDIHRQSHDGQTSNHNGWGRDGRDGWKHNGGNHYGWNQGGNWNYNGGNHNVWSRSGHGNHNRGNAPGN